MFDDLEFDNLLDDPDDCYECASDARYCYTHTHEAERTKKAMEFWATLKRMGEREEMDDIRTMRLATLSNIADKLNEINSETARLVAAAEHDDQKLFELRARVYQTTSYAYFCWSDEARKAEGMLS